MVFRSVLYYARYYYYQGSKIAMTQAQSSQTATSDLGKTMSKEHDRTMAGMVPLTTLISVEGTVIEVYNWPRHVFDFEWDGKRCLCFVLSRLLVSDKFQVGQRVRMTGEWSTTIAKLFEALTVERGSGA
jgi:hypothetical protein